MIIKKGANKLSKRKTSWQKRTRASIRRFGVDLARWPTESPAFWSTKLVCSLGSSVVLDVGANDGDYGRDLRTFGYQGRIVSFEPSSAARARLQREADARWEVSSLALGSMKEIRQLNIAGNHEASSSFLTMSEIHSRVAPDANYVGHEQVEVRRLDEMWPTLVTDDDIVFLKIDVQGFERHVLDGAAECLRFISGVRMELSLSEVYEDAPSWQELCAFMGELGFVLSRVDAGFTDRNSGRMLQFDGTFINNTVKFSR